MAVFTASTGTQFAYEDASRGNGAFTKAPVEAIKGESKVPDIPLNDKLTFNLLGYYLAEKVKALTGNKQNPTANKPEGMRDFPLAAF